MRSSVISVIGFVPVSVSLVWESFILSPGKGYVGMEPSSLPVFSVLKSNTASAVPAVSVELVQIFLQSQLLLLLLISQVLDFQVSGTLGLVDFTKEVFLNCGFLFDMLF